MSASPIATAPPSNPSTPSSAASVALPPAVLSPQSAFASLLTSSTHYGSDLWDAAPSVCTQSETSKQWLTKLSKFLKEKSELDREYAKSLKKLVVKLGVPDVPRVQDIPIPPAAAVAAAVALTSSGGGSIASIQAPSTLTPSSPTTSSSSALSASNPATSPSSAASSLVDPRSFDRFMMAFRNLHMTLATNFEILSAKIVEQVHKPLALHRDTHSQHVKRLTTDVDKYTQLYGKHLDTLLASRAACQKACQENELIRRKEASMSTLSPAAQQDLKAEVALSAKRALKADANYIQAVKTMRGFRQQTDAQLSHLLDQFESLEESKIRVSREVLSHYLGVQSSMFNSNLKNLIAVTSVLEKVRPEVDQQYFIMCNRTGKLPLPLPEYSVFRGHPNYAKVASGSSSGSNEEVVHGDLSGMSHASLDDDTVGASSAASSHPTVAKKPSGWAWLNQAVAAVVNTGKAGTNSSVVGRAHIDHDRESVLTRGGNYYDQKNGGGGDDDDDGFDGDSSAQSPRLGEDSYNETEEKTPERRAGEQALAEMFDAITGRITGSGMSPAIVSPSSAASPVPATTTTNSLSQPPITYSQERERDLTPAERQRARELFSTAEGRKGYSSVLNRQRNTSGGLRLTRTALLRLADLTKEFLDQAQLTMHVSPTQLVMIMAQSFYTEDPDPTVAAATSSPSASSSATPLSPSKQQQPSRVYLIAFIKDHSLWHDLRFWEEAFLDQYSTKILRSAAAKMHKWHSDVEQAESLHTRKQVCFSTLSTFSFNMRFFGHSPRVIVEFVEKLSSINELEPEQIEMLRSMEIYQGVDLSTLDAAHKPAVSGSSTSSTNTSTTNASSSSTQQSDDGILRTQEEPDANDDDSKEDSSMGEFESISAESEMP